MKVLFTCVGRRVELVQAFRSSAVQEKIELSLHGADVSSTAPALAFCDVRHVVPRVHDEKYIPKLLELCTNNRIDLLIPTIDTDLLLLSENKEKFESIGTKVLISDVEMVSLCRNKKDTFSLFDAVGLKAPTVVDHIEDYDGGYPAFIKPKDGSSSINAFKVCSREELIDRAKYIPNYIIQPYIDGEEYTVDVLCDFDGNPIFITPRKRLEVRAGEVLKTQIDNDAIIIAEVKKLVNYFKPCGPITVQLIRDKETGEDWYIEVNPRFGGGAPLSMKAGADSSKAILHLLQQEEICYRECAAEETAIYSRFDQSIRIN